jgi:HK97 gp10 family phage protein
MPARKGWGIEVLGLEDSVRAFKDAEDAFGATPLKECLTPIAERIRDRAKSIVSIGPGHKGRHLRDLIFATPGKRDDPSVIVGVDRKKAPHAHLVEMGHGGPHPAPAHPFLRPAFDAFRIAAKQLLGTEINNRIIRKLTAKRSGLARP